VVIQPADRSAVLQQHVSTAQACCPTHHAQPEMKRLV